MTELEDALLEAARVDLDHVVDVLKQFRALGGGRDDAYRALESIRERGNEVEDVILEAMDIVVGFCSPHMRIWPDEDD